MTTTTAAGAVGATDLDAKARDALAEVSDRFAAASSRRRERARLRRARHWVPVDRVARTIGEAFTLPIVTRLA